MVLAGTIDQQILFLVHQLLAIILAHLEVRRQLDGRRRAGFLAHATKDAAGEVDAEELRVPAAVFLLSLLQRDAVHRAGYRTQVAGHATLFAVRIAGQHNAAAVARWQIDLLFRVVHCLPLAKTVHEHHAQGAQLRPGGRQQPEHVFDDRDLFSFHKSSLIQPPGASPPPSPVS